MGVAAEVRRLRLFFVSGCVMPSQPPRFIPKGARTAPPTSGWRATSRKNRQERGYGRTHELMRQQVLREEPLCRMCLSMKPPRYTPATIADHITPKAEGGSDERDNYQGACAPCHKMKTAEEAKRARLRR